MCIADIAISRRCYSRTSPVPNSTILELKADPSRIAVSVVINPAADAFLGVYLAEADIGSNRPIAGISWYFTNANRSYCRHDLTLTYLTHPGIVNGRMLVWCSTATGFCVESLMQDDLANEVRQYLKDQRSAYTRRG
jgi:hypothetical protein